MDFDPLIKERAGQVMNSLQLLVEIIPENSSQVSLLFKFVLLHWHCKGDMATFPAGTNESCITFIPLHTLF